VDEQLRIHEYERQRMGQELHDSAGQLLVALQLSVARLKAINGDCGHEELIDEIQGVVSQVDREIRALAFLHYPAELGDRCVCSAVEALARGFGRRTGIRTSFMCVGDNSSVDGFTSLAMLRVAQEALVNVHRHSHATSAKVVLKRTSGQLRLTISDDGVGIENGSATGRQPGIGLQGMRHRIEALGGRLQVRRMKRGTAIAATVPVAA
jgi:signal transduction histidine kinase